MSQLQIHMVRGVAVVGGSILILSYFVLARYYWRAADWRKWNCISAILGTIYLVLMECYHWDSALGPTDVLAIFVVLTGAQAVRLGIKEGSPPAVGDRTPDSVQGPGSDSDQGPWSDE